jgi:23S rRNA (pseudouridine1915-N3)-methyltransferase
LKLHIITVGKISKSDLEFPLIEKYVKLSPFKICFHEIEIKKKIDSPLKLMQLEAEEILKFIPKSAYVISLDKDGNTLASEEFSKITNSTLSEDIVFIIGGAFGLDKAIKQVSHKLISFGRMTWPHKLAKVLLLEQIYRAYCITKNHPYHK